MAQGVDVLHRLGLGRKRSVGEGRRVGRLALRFAGRCLRDRAGGVHRLGLHMARVVLAYALRRHAAVVRCPLVGGSFPIMIGGRQDFGLAVRVGLAAKGHGRRVYNGTVRLASGLCPHLGNGSGRALHMAAVVLAGKGRGGCSITSPAPPRQLIVVAGGRNCYSLAVAYRLSAGAVGFRNSCGVHRASGGIAGGSSRHACHRCRDLLGEVSHSRLEGSGSGRIAVGVAAGPAPALQRVLLSGRRKHSDEVGIGGDGRQGHGSGAVIRAAQLPAREAVGIVLRSGLGRIRRSGGSPTGGHRLILSDLGLPVPHEELDGEARTLRPLGVEGHRLSHGVVFKVPGVLAAFFLVPTSEGEALLGRILGLSELLPLLHGLCLYFRAAVGLKAHFHKLRDVEVVFPGAAVMEGHALGAGA